MSDQDENGVRGEATWPLWLLVLSLVIVAALIFTVYHVEHGKTTAAVTQRDAALSSLASLSTDLETANEDRHSKAIELAVKDTNIAQCVQNVKQVPEWVQENMKAEEACHQGNADAAADFQRIKARAETFPPFDLAVKDFSKSISVFLGERCEKLDFAAASLSVDVSNCQLKANGTFGEEPSLAGITPTVALIVALAADELHKIANAPAPTEGAELTYEQKMLQDRPLAENYFIDGRFLWELFGDSDSFESYNQFSTHLFRLAAPLASDPEIVDALGTWVVGLVQEHRLITGKAGLLVRQYLADFWNASWADFGKINEWAEKDTELYSEYHDGCETDVLCPHQLTDRREGWFYRRWKAVKGGEAGEQLIAKYREHLITLADALGMSAEVKTWRKQMETGRGPTWPRPKT